MDATNLTAKFSASTGANTFRPFIDGLRAVSILAVVLYHVGVPGVTGGFIGVDVFFVISGFLIISQIRLMVR
jgi:peptidoglycan/LPS O-acetylase OafA/YrhL